MTLAAFLVALAGFAAIAMSTPRLRASSAWGQWGKPTGFTLLAASCLLRLGTPAWRIALIEWIGELTAAALIVLLMANWRAPVLRWIVPVALCGALLTHASWSI